MGLVKLFMKIKVFMKVSWGMVWEMEKEDIFMPQNNRKNNIMESLKMTNMKVRGY